MNHASQSLGAARFLLVSVVISACSSASPSSTPMDAGRTDAQLSFDVPNRTVTRGDGGTTPTLGSTSPPCEGETQNAFIHACFAGADNTMDQCTTGLRQRCEAGSMPNILQFTVGGATYYYDITDCVQRNAYLSCQ